MKRALWLVVPVVALSWSLARGDAAGDVLDKAPSKFAKSGDVKVHYKSLGEGKTAVVFIHGWCCDHTVWRDQAAAFDGKVRMLFVDLPGYGKSDKPKMDYTMDVFAKGIDAVLQDAGVEQGGPGRPQHGHAGRVPVLSAVPGQDQGAGLRGRSTAAVHQGPGGDREVHGHVQGRNVQGNRAQVPRQLFHQRHAGRGTRTD